MGTREWDTSAYGAGRVEGLPARMPGCWTGWVSKYPSRFSTTASTGTPGARLPGLASSTGRSRPLHRAGTRGRWRGWRTATPAGGPVRRRVDWDGCRDLDQQGPDPLGKELLIDAAHALRSPLSSIKGYSNTLLQVDVTWTPAEYREFLKTTDREADELNRAIDDLVHATGEELGTVNLNLEQATVESLFQIVEADLADESGQCQARFKCEQGLPPVLVD